MVATVFCLLLCFHTCIGWSSEAASDCLGDGFASSGLSFKLFDNGALANTPLSTGTTQTASLSLTRHAGDVCYLSGEMVGTIKFSESGVFQFVCHFFNTSTGWVWIDGHVICGDGNTFQPNPPDSIDNPLPIDRPLPFRARITSNDTSCDKVGSVTVSWKEIPHDPSSSAAAKSSFRLLADDPPQVSLTPCLPPAEERRDNFQRTLGYGWGAWLRHNIASLVKLPEGIVVTPKLCQISSNTCLEFAIPDDDNIRVGLHAYDRSYLNFHMAFQTANVTMEYSVQGDTFYCLITSAGFPNHDPFDYEIHLQGRYGWFRPGTVSTTTTAAGTPQLTFSTPGLGVVNVTLTTNDYIHSTAGSSSKAIPAEESRRLNSRQSEPDSDSSFLRILLTKPHQPIGFGAEMKPMKSEDIAAKLQVAKEAEQDRIRSKFGDSKYAMAEALQSAAMWTTIYNPLENDGLFTPVSRTDFWVFLGNSGAATTDWSYVLFGEFRLQEKNHRL
jgi:hypothetical protein